MLFCNFIDFMKELEASQQKKSLLSRIRRLLSRIKRLFSRIKKGYLSSLTLSICWLMQVLKARGFLM